MLFSSRYSDGIVICSRQALIVLTLGSWIDTHSVWTLYIKLCGFSTVLWFQLVYDGLLINIVKTQKYFTRTSELQIMVACDDRSEIIPYLITSDWGIVLLQNDF